MKLPVFEGLKCRDHQFLYEHDKKELYADNPSDFFSRYYKDRFCLVNRTADEIFESSGKSKSGFQVLDVGCAQGNFGLNWAENGWKVYGVDLQFNFLTYAALKYEKGSFFRINASLEKLPFQNDSFDLVYAGELIEHVAEPRELLKELNRVCKPRGRILLTTPNGGRVFQKLPTYAEVSGSSELQLRQFQPDADGHLFLMTKKELIDESGKAGLVLLKHHYFATPWVTGYMGWRFLFRRLPVLAAVRLDRLFLSIPGFRGKISENQLAVFQRKTES